MFIGGNNRRLFNGAIRVLILAFRFAGVICTYNILSASDYVDFSKFSAFILFFVFIFGLDYYTYSHRLIARKNSLYGLYFDQFLLFTLAAPLCWIVIFLAYDWQLAVIGTILFFAEACLQELYRLLVVLQRQVRASAVLATRVAPFNIFLIYIASSSDNCSFRELLSVWAASSAFSLVCVFIAVLMGAIPFPRAKYARGSARRVLRRSRTYGVCLRYFLGSLSFRGLVLVERALIPVFLDADTAALYLLIMALSQALVAILEATITSFAEPEILSTIDVRQTIIVFLNNLIKGVLLAALSWTAVYALMSVPRVSGLVNAHDVSLPLFAAGGGYVIAQVMFYFSSILHYRMKKDTELLLINTFCAVFIASCICGVSFFTASATSSLSVGAVLFCVFTALKLRRAVRISDSKEKFLSVSG